MFGELSEGLSEPERASRLALLERLYADGYSLEELKTASAAGRLSLLPVERLLARRRRHSLTDAAHAADLGDEFAEVNHRSLGLPLPEPDEPVYDDDQVENLKVLRGLLDLGVPEDDVHLMGRILGQSSHRTAQAVVDVLSRALLRPGDTEADLAVRLADVAEAMLPTLDRLTGAVLRLHLLDVVQREAIVRLEGDTGRIAGAREMAVAFADLAGFTALSERLPIEELGRVVARVEDLVLDVTATPVRLVKVLGDGAMLARDEPSPLVGSLLDLVDAAAAERLPPVHAGVAYGPALHSAGDWLGRTVNVAARLCAVAPAGTVLATHEAATEPHHWADAGTHRLRGIAEPVAALRAVRRAS
ncbi:MAG TPA: adenylate cyclase regulatory domain-containing protein [Solirubrobacteraceae bacterium]|jgi:adenylate cyclase|nr:adenylate cyclase regulatory domain-containing protein [Solirubrobacteraceae bacterium]